jgi:hypothetical protein
VNDRVQEVLVFVTVALAVAYLVRKLLFPGSKPARREKKPDVPLSALRRRPSERPPPNRPACH